MEQKRFLTADEVFQLFGVDTEALEALVKAGDIKALADLGTFKYRSEDFAKLVKAGKLTARTSGEMFQVDSNSDIPFLKVRGEDHDLKFDENVSFIELDEDALNEQAAGDRVDSKTPEMPDDWFEDVFGSGKKSEEISTSEAAGNSSDEVPVRESDPASHDEATEYELNIGAEPNDVQDSDSNVRIFDEADGIDFDEPDVMPTASDSDVRLEGPVSSARSSPSSVRKNPTSDSDVRLVSASTSEPASDSDVTIAWKPSGSAQAKAPESDSDVQLAGEHALADSDDHEEVATTDGKAATGDSDSDVILAGIELDDSTFDDSVKAKESDSDVCLADAIALEPPQKTSLSSDSDSDVRLADLSLESAIADETSKPVNLDQDSGIRLGDDESGIALDTARTDSDIAIESATDESGISLDSVHEDSGLTLHMEPGQFDSGISLDGSRTDSDIAIQPAFEEGRIAKESVHADSGLSLEKRETDSDITVDLDPNDSHISFGSDSGISLESENSDSGIMVEQGDSGLSLDRTGDSGISLGGIDSGLMLAGADSGIRMAGHDSGISLEDDSIDSGATLSDAKAFDFESDDSNQTQTLDLESADAIETGRYDGSKTMEMVIEDDEDSSSETAATIIHKSASKRPKASSLSEAFELEDSVEVEDLDISEDLDEAGEADYAEEFAEAEEEVLEASDDDFSAGEISAAEEAESESDEYTPAVKVRAAPKEPAWGMLAVGSVVCTSLVMAVTVTILWGGIVTMWTGREAPGPAGMLISTLAGFL